MGSDTTGQKLKGVEKSFSIVRFIKKTGPTTVTELADSMDLPKSTAHIHLKTMEESGYLHKDNRQYRLSLHFLDHGATARREFDIYKIGKEEVNNLARETEEVASIGVEEAGQRVLLYKVESGDALYDNAHTGEFTNIHWTSLGKAILAHLPSDRVEAIIDKHGLPSATPNTITERADLREELNQIQQQGYAIENEEHRENIRAVAVPVLSNGEIVGAISVSGPKSRFSRDRIQTELLELLENKANIIQLKLEYY